MRFGHRSYWDYVLLKILRNPLGALRSLVKLVREYGMDRRLGIATFRRNFKGPASARGDSCPCQPVPYETLQRMERYILDHGLPLDTFIDVGCGTGRPLAFFSRTGFRRLLGIDIDPAVAELARGNLRRLRPAWKRSDNFVVLVSDVVAAEVEFPGAVVFLANPFGEATMRLFVARLRDQALAHPQQSIHLFYCLPDCHRIIEEAFPSAPKAVIPGLRETFAYRLQAEAAAGSGAMVPV